MKRAVWPLDRIKPFPNNPRTHPEEQIRLLAEILKRYGPDQDIVVDEDAWILKGHGRHMAAHLAGLKDFPVTIRTGLTDADKHAMRIADNQLPLLSGWAVDIVRGNVELLKAANYPIKLLGFGDAQLVQFTTVPGPPAGGFQSFDPATIATAYECPACHYKWSGKPRPDSEEPKPAPKETKAAKRAAKKKK